jgi:hypothetical protein
MLTTLILVYSTAIIPDLAACDRANAVDTPSSWRAGSLGRPCQGSLDKRPRPRCAEIRRACYSNHTAKVTHYRRTPCLDGSRGDHPKFQQSARRIIMSQATRSRLDGSTRTKTIPRVSSVIYGRSVHMSVVVIRCPNTNREVSTHIEIEEQDFVELPDVLAHTHCSVCGLEHAWWKREARLVESEQQTAR